MGRIETFEHTADVGLRIWGDTLADLLVTAAEGLFDYVLVNRTEIREDVEESVSILGDSPEELLVEWLSELIFRSETQHRVFGRFEVSTADEDRSLSARIYGESIDAERHELDHEVKAVTRHGLIVRKEDGGSWFAELILDI